MVEVKGNSWASEMSWREEIQVNWEAQTMTMMTMTKKLLGERQRASKMMRVSRALGEVVTGKMIALNHLPTETGMSKELIERRAENVVKHSVRRKIPKERHDHEKK